MTETQYGLPSKRDSDGNLKPTDFTYDHQGQEITLNLIPPTISEMDRYEGMGDEVNFQDLYEIVDAHVVKPELPPPDKMTVDELIVYLRGIMEVGATGGTDLAADVREELEGRADDLGN